MINRRLSVLLAIGICFTGLSALSAADDKTWSNASYGVRLHMAIDSSVNPLAVSEQLTEQIGQLVHRNLYPYWKCEIIEQSGSHRRLMLGSLEDLDGLESSFRNGTDKTIYLTVEATGRGIQIRCREQDMLTKRWTPPLERWVRQELMLAQACFEIVFDVFSPRAMVGVDSRYDDQAELIFRGAALLSDANEGLLTANRSVFQPYLVATRPSGTASDKVAPVPWTYLVAQEGPDATWQAGVYSGTRRPFGARRRAGVDIVALELKPVAASTRVRFHAGHDPSQSLAGYEVFEKAGDVDKFQHAGFTDENGSVVVERREFPVTLVALRADAQPLVQVPVVPGAAAKLDIPVSDDAARLRVQESLTSFREQMIDVVARRNILMARARDLLAKGNPHEAKELLAKISDLPTRASMDRSLATLERDPGSRSENPRVQAKIDRLFADSRLMMSTYLTTRELLELESEVNSSPRDSPE